jgi:ammonium transporter, Amt family
MELKYAMNTLYVLGAGILVMFMALGFAMLEAGLVRAKNTVEILTKNVTLYALACFIYMIVGYNIMFPGEAYQGGIWSSVRFLLGEEHDVGQVFSGGENAPLYSLRAEFFFQVVFVATAMSVVSGAVAERMSLWAFLFFAVVMTGFIYPIQGFWHWGGGFLQQMGFIDFAGSAVVHVAGATAALAGVLLLGPRLGKYLPNGRVRPMPGANLPLATLGTIILWFGWFGFNGGSQLAIASIIDANTVAAVIVNTNMAAVGGVITATFFARILFGKADLTLILNGALAGLVAITASPDTPSPLMATFIGGMGSLCAISSILLLDKLKIDDPVGAISVHGVSGIWGIMAVPFSCATAHFTTQFLGLLAIMLWVFSVSLLVWWLIKKAIGLRVSEHDEREGIDIAECGIEAYPEFTKVQSYEGDR